MCPRKENPLATRRPGAGGTREGVRLAESVFICGGALHVLPVGRLGIKSKLRQRRAYRGLGDAKPDLVVGEVIAANQPEIPNAGAPREFDPPPILELIKREALDVLTKRQIFTKADHVEGDCGNR